MSITTDTGVVLTDDMLDKMAEEYESGTWEGRLGKVSVGRPPLSNEEMVSITFKVPKSRAVSIESKAKERGETRSQYLRDVVDRALMGLL